MLTQNERLLILTILSIFLFGGVVMYVRKLGYAKQQQTALESAAEAEIP